MNIGDDWESRFIKIKHRKKKHFCGACGSWQQVDMALHMHLLMADAKKAS